ncbi:homeobox KN domain-containing protein [Copromyces sp. CBS 386.78]|nr:homeobox KN domain-containing protein [Copromyces sp. CBS 386.78]
MATSFFHPPHHQAQNMHGLNMSSSQSDPRSLPSPGSALPPIRSVIPDFDNLDRRQSQAHKESIDGGNSHGYTTDGLPTTGSSSSISILAQHSHGHQEPRSRTYPSGPLPRPPLPDAFAQYNGHHQHGEPQRGYTQYGQHQPVHRQDTYPPHGYPQDSYYSLPEHRHGVYPQPGPQQNHYEQRARSERARYPHPWGSQSDSAVSPRGGDGGKNKRRGNLPKEVTEKLYAWLYGHLNHPYPTEDEKQKMMRETNMQMNQISNWFINARRRKVPLLIEQAKAETEAAKHYRPNSSPIARRTRPVSVSHTRHYSRSGPGRGVPSRRSRSASAEPSISNLLNNPESEGDVRPPQYAAPMSDSGVLDYSSRESSESYEMDPRYQSYGHGHGHGHHASI